MKGQTCAMQRGLSWLYKSLQIQEGRVGKKGDKKAKEIREEREARPKRKARKQSLFLGGECRLLE